MNHTPRSKLFLMMVLEFFIWGAWLPPLFHLMGAEDGLNFNAGQQTAIGSCFAIASVLGIFFSNQFADRNFASEKFLAFSHLVGGLAIGALYWVKDFPTFFALMLVHSLFYVPTISVGNSLAFANMKDPAKEFGLVRMGGTIGWILASWPFFFLLQGKSGADQINAERLAFLVAGIASLLLAAFSLTLPHTPPKKTGADVSIGEILGFDALALMKRPPFAIFIACMFLICIPLYFYFVMMSIYLTELGWEQIAAKMTLAQVSDVVFLFLLPVFLKTLGYKATIFIGILAWVLRYFALAGSVHAAGLQTPLIFAAIGVHGVCYDFLFIAGQLYVDDEANERIRGAAQGFIAFILWGAGAFVGTWLAGRVLAAHQLPAAAGAPVTYDWQAIWNLPAWGAVAVLALFVLFFRNPARKVPA